MTSAVERVSRLAWRPTLCAVGLLAAVGLPFLVSSYWVRVLTTVLLSAVLASALNLIAGYAGYPAFGNVVFFGLGAYAAAIAMARWGLPFGAGAALGVGVSTAFALVVGWPLLRLRGHYFAIATLGMNEAMRALVENLSALTGGGMGLSTPSVTGDVVFINRYFYFLLLSLLVAVLGTTAWVAASRFGYGTRSIRFDETAASSCGVPTTRYKLTAWALSAIFTSLAGSAYAYWFAYIEPSAVFDMTISVKMFVMMLLGGMATVFGPVLGALVIELVAHVAWSQLLVYHSAVFALVIVGVTLLLPAGLLNVSLPRAPSVVALGLFDWRAPWRRWIGRS